MEAEATSVPYVEGNRRALGAFAAVFYFGPAAFVWSAVAIGFNDSPQDPLATVGALLLIALLAVPVSVLG